MRLIRLGLPLGLLASAVIATGALAASSPGFSKHTAVDATLNGTATVDATNAPHATHNSACGVKTNDHVVWFKWTASETGSITADTANSYEDTVLFVYQGAKEIGCNDDNNSVACNYDSNCSQVVFDATEGQTYYFAVASYDGSSGALVNLDLSG